MGTTNLAPVPLFGIGNYGKSANVSAQKRLNLYVELNQIDPEKGILTLYPTPGTIQFVDFGASPSRGMWEKDNYMYVVNGNTLWRVANDGTKLSLGSLLTSSGRVDMCDNGTQLIVVDGLNGYIYNFNTLAFVQITAAGWSGADTVTFLNGYFIVQRPNSGQFAISALYDGTLWNALDFATAESDPDNLVRVMVDTGIICLFGQKTTEFWGDSGALDFPFARIGASAIQWGLAARWTLCKFMDSLMFLRKNRLGQVQVCALKNYTATSVSNPELDYIFSQYPDVSNATAFAYMVSGHPFYQINFPTGNESWLFDGLSMSWSKVGSNTARHIGEIQVNYLNKSYVSDYSNGKLYRFDTGTYTDNGAQISREFISRHQMTANWTSFDELWIEMEAGKGLNSGQGDDPMIMMQVSKDGGHQWGTEIWMPFGKMGEYKRRAVFRRLGRARDWLFKFRITDPVKTVFVAAWGRFG
jgi:hypothetical protein